MINGIEVRREENLETKEAELKRKIKIEKQGKIRIKSESDRIKKEEQKLEKEKE